MKKYNGKLKESKNKSNINVHKDIFIIRPFFNRDSATASATYLSSNDHSQSNIKLGSIQQRPLRFPRTINNSRKKKKCGGSQKSSIPFLYRLYYILHWTHLASSAILIFLIDTLERFLLQNSISVLWGHWSTLLEVLVALFTVFYYCIITCHY